MHALHRTHRCTGRESVCSQVGLGYAAAAVSHATSLPPPSCHFWLTEDLMYVADENNWGTFIEKAVRAASDIPWLWSPLSKRMIPRVCDMFVCAKVALHRFVRLGHRGKLETPRTLTVYVLPTLL